MNLEILKRKSQFSRKNPTLLFIHGAAGGAWYFNTFLEYFAHHGYDSYAISLRGHGNSEGIEDIDSFSLNDYMQDVKHTIDQFEDKPILIGHSMGGAIVQKYLDMYQDDVLGAVLLSSADSRGIDQKSPLGLFFSDAKAFMRDYRKPHQHQRVSLLSIMNDTIFSNRFSEDELKVIRTKLTKESERVKKDLLNPFVSENFSSRIPILVIGSRNDHIVREEQILSTAYLLQAEHLMVDHVCHFMTIDPEWIRPAEAIKDWLIKTYQ
ncbi:MAG: alpha/beta hydrolase [Acholeplasmataceae bacterium]|nr:alpha/beta hydrolase [Acholeplasmataceae bacterium]